MATVRRFDRGELQKPVREKNGWLRVDGFLTRTGVFTYKRADGSEIKEYRPADEVFNSDTLDSFAAVPLTDDHPPEGFLTSDNTAQYQKGVIIRPHQDGKFVRSQILVTDKALIEKMEAGKNELSGGYICDLEDSPGEFEGERYDAIQRNIRGNHVALVSVGRAGPEVRVRLDSTDAAMVASTTTVSEVSKEHTMKIRIDGVDYEVSESAGQAFEKASGAFAAEAKASKIALEQATARADAAEAEAKQVKADLAAAPAKIKSEIVARVALEGAVAKVLSETKLDELADIEIKRAFAAKVMDMKLDGKGDAYVEAMYDVATKKAADAPTALEVARTESLPVKKADSDSIEAAKAKYYAASRAAYQSK